VYRVGQKNRLFLRVNNFATFNGSKACNLSKVSKFCVEKEYYLYVSEFKYFLASLHKYLLPLCWRDNNTFFQNFVVSAAVSELGNTDLDQELQ